MRLSQFRTLMSEEFGEAYAGTLARDHVLGELGNRTPDQAIEAGLPLRQVWLALCVDMDVPRERWFGRDVRPQG
ncbi:MAG: DUF3046 domain-containing protein [Micrococcales bacterium]|nr:DUF3046 domain-containing protein [Micrococcales bacterium]